MATLRIVVSIDRSCSSARVAALGIDGVASVFDAHLFATREQRDSHIGKKPSSNLRSEHLFKAVLKAQAGTPFCAASNLQLCANASSVAVEHRHARYDA
jgi:hypothetical protein